MYESNLYYSFEISKKCFNPILKYASNTLPNEMRDAHESLSKSKRNIYTYSTYFGERLLHQKCDRGEQRVKGEKEKSK